LGKGESFQVGLLTFHFKDSTEFSHGNRRSIFQVEIGVE
jgi:hypothetical protein